MTANRAIIGRVLRANTQGFACGAHSTNIGAQHDFGVFVKSPIANETHTCVIGLIYAVEIQDDQLVNELVMSEYVDNNVLSDQRKNRMVPVEIKVLNIGYMIVDENGNKTFYQSLPPRPPMSLSDVAVCDAEEIYQFTQQYNFFRVVLEAPDVPAEALLASAIRYAASARAAGENSHYPFLVQCGRQLAQDLATDLKRLAHVLELIHPHSHQANNGVYRHSGMIK